MQKLGKHISQKILDRTAASNGATIIALREFAAKCTLKIAPRPESSLDPHSRSSIPTELRLKIWRLCWEPRIVEVHPYITDRKKDDEIRHSSDTYRSKAPPPNTLFICHESRNETLRHYALTFAAQNQEPQIYFNFEIDTLYLKEADIFRLMALGSTFDRNDLNRVRHLAIAEVYLQYLVGIRARHPGLLSPRRPLLYMLLDTRAVRPNPNVLRWDALERLSIVVAGPDNELTQRMDRMATWIRDDPGMCPHCIRNELTRTARRWGWGKMEVDALSPDLEPYDLSTSPPRPGGYIARPGGQRFLPCCRARLDELLTEVQQLQEDEKLNEVGICGFGPWKIISSEDTDVPCRCRFLSYFMGEGRCIYNGSIATLTDNDYGREGNLLLKWLPESPGPYVVMRYV